MATKFVLTGSGLAGGLLGAYLGRRGYEVALYERRSDPRAGNFVGGRSINLAVSTRGIHALEQLGIAQRTVEHPAVFTVEEAKALRGDLPGHHIKNLFLRNKKEEMWLVVALEDRAIDLKRLCTNKNVPETLRTTAVKLQRQRSEFKK